MSSEEPDHKITITVDDFDGSSRADSNTSEAYDGSRWDLSQRHVDSSISLSQVSLATTNTADVSSSFVEGRGSTDRFGLFSSPEMEQRDGESEEGKSRQFSGGYYGSTIINEKHANFVLMYDMLTGIRIAMSSCQAKPARPLTDSDFSRVEKLGFDSEGNETTPSSRFEFKFKDYAPWVFRFIREASRIDAADYLMSLTGKYVLSELGSSGKSGSFFYYSQDLRFIIKTIRRSEHIFLRQILKYYYEHLRNNPNTLITRIFGLHRLRMSSTRKIYFVVMGNIFPPNKEVHEFYDLKGSTQGRLVPQEDIKPGMRKALKDLNWVENQRKLILGPAKATLLMNQLRSDCQFLAKLNIMDYSLLVGLHSIPKGNTGSKSMTVLEPTTVSHSQFKQSEISLGEIDDVPMEKKFSNFYSEEGGIRSSLGDNSRGSEIYFLGIIDILTPYDAKKKVEHLFKSIQYSKESISAVSPTDYCKRFLKFMADNIIQDRKNDYANKSLPEIPEEYDTTVGEDDLVIVNNRI